MVTIVSFVLSMTGITDESGFLPRNRRELLAGVGASLARHLDLVAIEASDRTLGTAGDRGGDHLSHATLADQMLGLDEVTLGVQGHTTDQLAVHLGTILESPGHLAIGLVGVSDVHHNRAKEDNRSHQHHLRGLHIR